MNYTPLKMAPCYKEYLWGGTRLKTEFGKVDAPDVTAESWEFACHRDGVSTIKNGPLAGRPVTVLGELDREGFWGKDCQSNIPPLLVKLIDAQKDLSIQVHPSDDTALVQIGEQGKAEMWYIVDCEPQASIYYGFSKEVSRAEFIRRSKEGTICDVLNKVPVAKGDVFYILPGTIHAIGAGIIIAEIQQNSNTTFRVYDYQRCGPDGKLRELHLDRAADVVDCKPIVPSECKANSGVTFPEFTMVEMFSCPYFRAYRADVRTSVHLFCDGHSFQHLVCVEGEGTIRCMNQEYPICRGDSYLMPAKLGEYIVEGACRILLSRI